jgi:hypothetical protein
MLKLHRLLFAPTEELAYHAQIAPTDSQQGFLRGCRNKIRDFLRPRLEAATTAVLGMPHPVTPC